jgi:rRNA maturation endonuclease Nob1
MHREQSISGRHYECRDCLKRFTSKTSRTECPDCGGRVGNVAVVREG